MDEHSATYETKDEALKSDPDFVRFWLSAIDAAGDEEKDWRADADEVVCIYRGDKEHEKEFNIVYSNVETLLPAIYNSIPVPDVRRRYGDRDELGKLIAQILERAISYSVDSYDFDAVMRGVLFDSSVPGRGVARVRYIPVMGADGQVAYEEATCEYVPWSNFRHGAARVWDEVPWIAFEHFLSRDELRRLNPELADKVQLDCSTRGADAEEGNQQKSDIFKRARVWEIWDKESKEAIFIATGYGEEALRRERDPLGLSGFYPIPRPVQPITTPGKLVPVTPYNSYKYLAEELNSVTARIKKLVKQLRVKGGYASGGGDIEAMSKADDGEIVPLQGMEQFINGGDINKLVMWWPMEPTVKALQALYQQREAIKQTIYEVTGISDIVRGQSAASETATAQNIKNQWGSLRIQRMQNEVQRFARDLFRLKAEIFATKFSIQNLIMMTGVQVPPEALPQIEQVMKSDLMRTYKIDVESDSTIRADLTRNQENMSNFLNGTAQYISAVGPAVQAGQMPGDVAVEIYTAFARNFKLGKQAEDALDKMGEEARKAAQQPKQPKPDPEAEKAKGELMLEQQRMQMQAQQDERKMQLDAASKQQDAALAGQKLQADMAMQQQKFEFEAQLAQQKLAQEFQLKQMELEANLELKRREAEQNMELARETAGAKFALEARSADQRAELDAKRAKAGAKN